MLREELPFVLATVHAYPYAQLSRSAANFREQFTIFGIYDFDPSSWVAEQFDSVLPASRAAYLRGRQAQNTLPLEGFTILQFWVVVASAGVIGISLVGLGRSTPGSFLALFAMTAYVTVINAAVTGVLSMPEDRFQGRVVWMVPFLAALLLWEWIGRLLAARRTNYAFRHSRGDFSLTGITGNLPVNTRQLRLLS
jgi:hypothetical protein